jgi:hypothetical protein
MATNPYLNLTNRHSEQDLVEDVTVELIKATGQDCLYIPRKYFNIDKIFGEDPASSFEKTYTVEMYILSYKGFEGTDIITQFGVEIKDKINLLVARRRFKQQISNYDTTISRPREGDLIYFPLSKSLFEINFVEHENPLYPLGKLYSYVITAELFTYSYEKINTQNNNIDTVYNISQDDSQYILAGGTGSFTVGNIVKLQSGITVLGEGTVSYSNNNIIKLSGITGTFGYTGNTSYIVYSNSNPGVCYSSIQNYTIPKNNILGTTAGINDNLQEEAEELNFDINNPFD